jgi:hypothetical protein
MTADDLTERLERAATALLTDGPGTVHLVSLLREARTRIVVQRAEVNGLVGLISAQPATKEQP